MALSTEDGRIYLYFADRSTVDQIESLGFKPHSFARHPVPPRKDLCTTEAVVGDHV